MALLRQGDVGPQQEQVQMTDEQQRDIKMGMISTRLRRYWRIVCLIWAAIMVVANIIEGFGPVMILLNLLALAAVYGIVLYLFFYLCIGGTIRAYLYITDLFRKGSDTRL